MPGAMLNMTPSNPPNNPAKWVLCCPHLTDEQTEVQHGFVTCPSSHTQVASSRGQDLYPGSVVPKLDL